MFLFDDHESLWGPAPAYGPPAISLSDRWDLHALVDEEDLAWSRQWKWNHTTGSGGRIADIAYLTGAKKRGVNTDKVYAKRSTRAQGRAVSLYLHREICLRAYGQPPSDRHVADHLNGDSLDCRRENLRWATLSQNAKNLFGSAWLQLRMDL